MAKKKVNSVLCIGAIVHKKTVDYNTRSRKTNVARKYKIRSIGPKQCTLDRVDHDTERIIGHKGQTLRLYTERETMQWSNPDNAFHYPTKWNQMLTPAGQDGWDPIENY